jgi:hypothetical protein
MLPNYAWKHVHSAGLNCQELLSWNCYALMVICLHAGEEKLRKSGTPYTIVRPGGLSNEPAGKAQLVAAQVGREDPLGFL